MFASFRTALDNRRGAIGSLSDTMVGMILTLIMVPFVASGIAGLMSLNAAAGESRTSTAIVQAVTSAYKTDSQEAVYIGGTSGNTGTGAVSVVFEKLVSAGSSTICRQITWSGSPAANTALTRKVVDYSSFVTNPGTRCAGATTGTTQKIAANLPSGIAVSFANITGRVASSTSANVISLASQTKPAATNAADWDSKVITTASLTLKSYPSASRPVTITAAGGPELVVAKAYEPSTNVYVPINSETPEVHWVQVATGSYQSVAIDSLGKLYTWGKNPLTSANVSTPTALVPDKTFLQVAAGNGWAAALDIRGKLWVWGATLNIFNVANTETPAAFLSSDTFQQISGENATLMMVKTDGYVTSVTNKTTVSDSDDLLVNPFRIAQNTAAADTAGVTLDGKIKRLNQDPQSGISSVASACVRTAGDPLFLLKSDGTLNNAADLTSMGTAVDAGKYVDVVCGYNYVLAVTTDGKVKGLGPNGAGQLGTGNTATQSTIAETGVTNIAMLTTAYSQTYPFTAAIDKDGRLLMWGSNQSGQLGQGTVTTLSATPVEVAHP